MSRLDAPLEPEKAGTFRAHLAALPAAVSERLASRDLEGSIRLAFEEPPPTGAEMVARSHPLPATLAESLLEGVLDPSFKPGSLAGARRRVADVRNQSDDDSGVAAASL